MSKLSNAEQLLKIILKDPLKWINDAVKERTEEDLFLEFKTLKHFKKGDLSDKEDKRNYAKALSGFANSQGGLLIWGVEARKDSNGRDAAFETQEIHNLRQFKTALESGSVYYVNPPVVGVEHYIVETSPESNKGFIISFIPQSDDTHRAKVPSLHTYFCRVQDSFLIMEHYQLMDRLGRRPQPKLDIEIQADKRIWNFPDSIEIFYIVGIKNSGKGSAKYPALRLIGSQPPDRYGLDGNYRTGLPQRPISSDPNEVLFAGGIDHVIYPNTTFQVTRYLVKVDKNSLKNPMRDKPYLTLNYEIYADEMRPVKGKKIITLGDIVDELARIHN